MRGELSLSQTRRDSQPFDIKPNHRPHVISHGLSWVGCAINCDAFLYTQLGCARDLSEELSALGARSLSVSMGQRRGERRPMEVIIIGALVAGSSIIAVIMALAGKRDLDPPIPIEVEIARIVETPYFFWTFYSFR
jgi:hypothetical protein